MALLFFNRACPKLPFGTITGWNKRNFGLSIKKIMKVLSGYLIEDLKKRTRSNIQQAEKLKSLSKTELNWRTNEMSWSILECFAHLNILNSFYITEIRNRIRASSLRYNQHFKSGWLGNYFAQMMYPKGNFKKVKTLKKFNPLGQKLSKDNVTSFITDQNSILIILEDSLQVDLNRTRTSIAFPRFLKLKLGDTLRILVYHNQRHVQQAVGLLEIQRNSTNI